MPGSTKFYCTTTNCPIAERGTARNLLVESRCPRCKGAAYNGRDAQRHALMRERDVMRAGLQRILNAVTDRVKELESIVQESNLTRELRAILHIVEEAQVE